VKVPSTTSTLCRLQDDVGDRVAIIENLNSIFGFERVDQRTRQIIDRLRPEPDDLPFLACSGDELCVGSMCHRYDAASKGGSGQQASQ
jgi:hypothetical protein